MIHKESWYIESQERVLQDLIERFRRGDTNLVPAILQTSERSGKKLPQDILWEVLSYLSWDQAKKYSDQTLPEITYLEGYDYPGDPDYVGDIGLQQGYVTEQGYVPSGAGLIEVGRREYVGEMEYLPHRWPDKRKESIRKAPLRDILHKIDWEIWDLSEIEEGSLLYEWYGSLNDAPESWPSTGGPFDYELPEGGQQLQGKLWVLELPPVGIETFLRFGEESIE